MTTTSRTSARDTRNITWVAPHAPRHRTRAPHAMAKHHRRECIATQRPTSEATPTDPAPSPHTVFRPGTYDTPVRGHGIHLCPRRGGEESLPCRSEWGR